MNAINKLKVLFRDQSGVSMIFSLMALLVLSILGIGIATVSMNNVQLTSTDRDYQSTYYIAEAGLNQAFSEVSELINGIYETHSSEVDFYNTIEREFEDKLNRAVYQNFRMNFGDQPEAEIHIEKLNEGNPREYMLSSTGTIGKRERTVEQLIAISWRDKGNGGGQFPPRAASSSVTARSRIELEGSGSIVGDVYLASDRAGAIKISGGPGNRISGNAYVPADSGQSAVINLDNTRKPNITTHSNELSWQLFNVLNDSFPKYNQYPFYPDVTIYLHSNYHDVVKNGSFFNTSYAAENYTLLLDGNYQFNRMHFVSARTLFLSSPHDTVNIVVRNFDLINGHIRLLDDVKINLFVLDNINIGSGSTINRHGKTENFSIYYLGDKSLEINNFVKLHGLLYAPFSDVLIQNSGEVFGAVIADSIKIVGHAGLTHEDINIEFLGGPDDRDEPGDLISAEPPIEKN